MPMHRSTFAPWLVVPFVLAACGGADDSGETSLDVVEVAPAYDVAEITALAAATIAWEYLALQDVRALG